MTKFLDKEGLTEYTKLMKAHVAKSTLKIGESSGTAYDGAKGKANADFIASVKFGNLTLVSPTIKGKWSVTNSTGTPVTSMDSTNNSLSLENGFKASWTGTFSYPAAGSGQKAPNSVSGNWSKLPSAGVESEAYTTPTAVTTNTNIFATISAPKTGLMVVGSDVKPASGNDSKSATASVSFYHRRYFGLTSNKNITGDVIKGLSKTDLNNSRTAHLTNISATDAQYYVIAYPKAMGELNKIVQNGATPLLNGGFAKTESLVVNEAGAEINYLVYRTINPGALKDNSFLDIA